MKCTAAATISFVVLAFIIFMAVSANCHDYKDVPKILEEEDGLAAEMEALEVEMADMMEELENEMVEMQPVKKYKRGLTWHEKEIRRQTENKKKEQ